MSTIIEQSKPQISEPDKSVQLKPRTLKDVVSELGGISLERIRKFPSPGNATEKDVLEPSAKSCELIDGTLVEKAAGFYESMVVMAIGAIFLEYFRKNGGGYVSGSDGQIWFGSNVRMPDVGVFKKERLPNPQVSISDVSPNLTIEVLSPSNTIKEMDRKRDLYFKHGVEQCWFVDCEKKTIAVWTTAQDCHIYQRTDQVDMTTLFPELVINVNDMFIGIT